MANQEGPPAATGAGGSQADLAASVARISSQVRETQQTYAAMRRQLLLFALVVVVIIVTFAGALYARMRDNITADKLKDELQRRAELLLPKLQEQVVFGVHDAAPTYRDLVMQRVPVFAPVLGDRVTASAKKFGEQINSDLSAQGKAMFDRIADRIEKDLQQQYPKLTPEKLLALGEKIKHDVIVPSDQLAEHIKALTLKEQERVFNSLEKLPIPEYKALKRDELARRLVHNLLMLTDYEVQMAGTEQGLDKLAPALQSP